MPTLAEVQEVEPLITEASKLQQKLELVKQRLLHSGETTPARYFSVTDEQGEVIHTIWDITFLYFQH